MCALIYRRFTYLLKYSGCQVLRDVTDLTISCFKGCGTIIKARLLAFGMLKEKQIVLILYLNIFQKQFIMLRFTDNSS